MSTSLSPRTSVDLPAEVSVYLPGSQVDELAHPEEDERLRKCYEYWHMQGQGDVLSYLYDLVERGGFNKGQRRYEATVEDCEGSGFNLKRRYRIIITENQGHFNFQVTDLDVKQADIEEHRLQWARDLQGDYERAGGFCFELSEEDYEYFLATEHTDKPQAIEPILIHGICTLLREQVEGGIADRIITMTRNKFSGGLFGVEQQGDERGSVSSWGLSADPIPLRLQGVGTGSFMCSGFQVPEIPFASLANHSFPKITEQGDLMTKIFTFSQIMAALNMPAPRSDFKIQVIGVPSEAHGDSLFLFVRS